jgi:hypothetical protein
LDSTPHYANLKKKTGEKWMNTGFKGLGSNSRGGLLRKQQLILKISIKAMDLFTRLATAGF